MKYYIISSDMIDNTVEEAKTIEELKKIISKIQNDKWTYLEKIIYGKEVNINDVA